MFKKVLKNWVIVITYLLILVKARSSNNLKIAKILYKIIFFIVETLCIASEENEKWDSKEIVKVAKANNELWNNVSIKLKIMFCYNF